MTNAPLTIIEPGIGGVRSADIGADELPTDLRFHDDERLSPLEAVYAARITNIDTASDLAFADLGNGRTGVMNVRRARLRVKGQVQSIKDCVTEGERLLVQVTSEPSALEAKAFSVTPRPRLMGRYLVAEAGGSRLNFSKDLPPKVIKALEADLKAFTGDAVLIVRRSAAAVPADAVIAEAERLTTALMTGADAPGLVFAFSPLEKALLGAPEESEQILVEGGNAFADAKTLAGEHWPDLLDRLAPYKESEPAFEHFGVNEAIEEALGDRIELPSGGWISLTETPAMTVVDVNMGGALKGRSANEARLQVNMEAALATLYHLRFQDIGGLVVVDFIDMSAKGAAKELMTLIEHTARTDRVPLSHTGLSTFGLVEFARKRSGVSLRGRMQAPGLPRRRASAVAIELLRRGTHIGRTAEPGALIVSGPEPVIGWLKANEQFVEELETATQRAVELMLGAETDVFLRG